jgi:amino acid transporter
MAGAVIVIFWLGTFLNLWGMKISGFVSSLGAIVGTILPMILIALMGALYYLRDEPLSITFSWDTFFPSSQGNTAFLTNVLFGLMGLEMAATHAAEMKNPQRDYPKSVLIASVIILSTIVLASLAIGMIVPSQQLQLATGAIQAFSYFLHAFHIDWATPLIAGLIILGGLSGMGAWIIGPSKGIMVASADGSLPPFLKRMNRHGVPVNVLLLQAFLVTILSLAFVLMPSVNSSFWILSAITAQLALLMYCLLFFSAIRLHHTKPEVSRYFNVPGKKICMWVISGMGMAACVFVLILGFIPPAMAQVSNTLVYVACLLIGMVFLCVLPLILFKWINKIPLRKK